MDYAVTTSSKFREKLDMDKYENGGLVESVYSDGRKWSDNPDNVLVNAYYNGNVGKLNIDFNTDMYFMNSNEHQMMQETATSQDRDVESISSSTNDMVAAKLVQIGRASCRERV